MLRFFYLSVVNTQRLNGQPWALLKASDVCDPDLSPANGSIALVATQEHGLLMRRWFRGGNTLMLVADSHTTHDDIIIFSNEPVHVLGTVVLALSPAPLS